MAQEVITSASLQIVYANGLNEDGDQVFQKKNYSNLSPTASGDDVLAVANSISSLQQKELQYVNEVIVKLLHA